MVEDLFPDSQLGVLDRETRLLVNAVKIAAEDLERRLVALSQKKAGAINL